MTLRFAYTCPDGGTSIVIAAPKDALERVLGPLSDADYRKHVLSRSIPGDATDVTELKDGDELPDRSFRNAWTLRGGALDIDMPKARDIHRQRMRNARAPRLAALDVEYQRADESGDASAKASIAARKQALRDVTADPRIDEAGTPGELLSVWPDVIC